VTNNQYTRLRAYAMTICPQWGEDYLQEALLRALESRTQNVAGYANACIRTIHIDRIRRENQLASIQIETEVFQNIPVDIMAALDDMEFTILRAYAEGVTPQDIAKTTGLSPRHVRRVVTSILNKCKTIIE
jgi:DNA-directed RNA polymerase specialized sigma24 family protein